MKNALLVSTALGLLIATSASAQSPSGANSGAQASPPSTSSTSSTQPQSQPSGSSSSSTSSSTSSSSPSTAQQTQTDSARSQAAPGTSQTQTGRGETTDRNATTNTTNTNNTNTNTTNTSNTKAPDRNGGSDNRASDQTKTGSGAASRNAPDNAAAQSTKSSSTQANDSVKLDSNQQSRVSTALSKTRVESINNVNFSVSVGTVVPRNVSLHTLPADVVDIVPQYRGYSYMVVRDEIVIVEPSSHKIVMVLPRSGKATATAPAKRTTITEKDRAAVRKYSKSSSERRTVGSSASVTIRKGERVPTSIEIEEFPEPVYREAPALREYRYIRREDRTFIVDPEERTVIEEID